MAVYPVEDADWIADSVMIRHDQNLKKASDVKSFTKDT